MSASPRFIPARVVGRVEFAGDGDAVSGPRRKRSPKQRQIRRKLRRAHALKKRIAHLRIRKPLGWKGAVRQAKVNLRVVMSDLKMLGWKPKKPRRELKPGEDEMDAALDEIPEPEPRDEDDEPDEELEDLPDAPATDGEPNWLDQHVGAWSFKPKKAAARAAKPAKSKPNFFTSVKQAFAPKWSAPVPLGEGARIQTAPGQRAMVATVSPGLFIVQLVSDAAAKKIAGDNIGVLPLLLYPLVKDKVRKALAPKPAPAAQPAPAPAAAPAQPAPAPTPARMLGCDGCSDGG